MTLREWLDKLENFDPDDWGELEQLRTTFTKEDLEKVLELEITFTTKDGIVNQVLIQLFDDHEIIVDLSYQILQLDSVVLAEFIEEAAFPPDKPNTPS